MESTPTMDPSHPYTMLRIKRKRNEEPLDALVVDSKPRKKKSRGGLNVFQFAETVEEGAWDEEKAKELHARISSLAIKEPANPPLHSTSNITPSSSFSPDPNRSYTIVKSESQELASSKRRAPAAPPKIISKKEYDAQQATFKMYEAIPSNSSLANTSTDSASMAMDPEMAKFLPMLQEYLRVNDSPLPTSGSSSLRPSDDDYVWDVFYQRPTTFEALFEPNAMVGTLTGLPPSNSELFDSDDDSDYEDEDDEDSNAEDWYTNDYPEEDSDSSFGVQEEEQDSDDSDNDPDHEEFRSRGIDDYLFRREPTE